MSVSMQPHLTVAGLALLSFTISWSLLRFMSIESVMLFNHLNLCRPVLPSIFPSISVVSNESALCIRWQKRWSFSFSISPSNEYSRLISFKMDWFDLADLEDSRESSPAPQFESISSSVLSLLWASLVAQRVKICQQCRRPRLDPCVSKIPWRREWLPTPVFLPGELHGQRNLEGYSPWGGKESAFFMVQLLHQYVTTGKAITLTIQTFVSKLRSLLFNMLSRFVITFLPRSKCLLIS